MAGFTAGILWLKVERLERRKFNWHLHLAASCGRRSELTAGSLSRKLAPTITPPGSGEALRVGCSSPRESPAVRPTGPRRPAAGPGVGARARLSQELGHPVRGRPR